VVVVQVVVVAPPVMVRAGTLTPQHIRTNVSVSVAHRGTTWPW
jgi:hypothetical protein